MKNQMKNDMVTGFYLRNDVQVGNESRLEDNRNIGGVEEFDGVAGILSAVPGRFDGQIDAESLEVDDNGKDEHRRQQIHQIGQVLAVESFTQRAHLVLSSGQQVEKGNNGAFEFSAAASVDRRRRERLPHDRFANVGGDEERNARTQTVAFLQQLVQQQDNQTGNEQLDDDQQANATADFARVSVHARHDVNDGLADSDYHAKD